MTGFITAFREVAGRYPQAIALEQIHPDGVIDSLSYEALDARAASLAHTLEDRGVVAGEVVGISCGRSIEHVISMLALWQLDAAFVTLDIDLPASRRARIVDKARVRFFIDASLHISSREQVATEFDRSLAYVCFSSGSTGEPKGIAVSHVGVVPMLRAQIEAFAIEVGSRALWLYGPAFDASISDIGTALLSGATLVVDRRDLLKDTTTLQQTLRTQAITHIDLPPSLLGMLALDALPKLECIILGGERAEVREVQALAAKKRVINVYGPTEATVCTSLVRCDAAWSQATIGLPLPHIRYRIEGGHEGELWIVGTCLALGYLQDDALTRSRFVMHEGERFFRTGDLVRNTESPHGFVFLGRIDRQCKIDGKIACPEEVERTFRELFDTEVCVVATRTSPPRLVAFSDASLDEQALRRELAKHLPAHLVPSRCVHSALPRNGSGKLDLPALAELADTLFPKADLLPASSSYALLGRLAGQPLSGTMTLDALGLSSLDRVQLLAALRAEGRAISSALMRDATIDAIWAAPISEESITTDQLERALPKDVLERLPTSSQTTSTKTTLITGATGFFGRHWLRCVLTQRADHVICLVRGSSESEAKARLLAMLEDIHAEHLTRLEVVLGDVERDHFGLANAAYEALAARVNHVVHSAALMSVVESRQSLWNANVLGTARVLAFMHQGPAKSLDYISTLAVFASTDRADESFHEHDTAKTPCRVFGGYAQTKWAAEQLVQHAQARSAQPVRIHRLGLLVGNLAPTDWLSATLRGLVNLGVYPADLDTELALDMTPVREAAHACIALHDAPSATFHIRGRKVLFRELVTHLKELGHPLTAVSRATFRNLLIAQPGSASATLQLAFERMHGQHGGFDLFLNTRRSFSMTQTLEALRVRHVPAPSLSDAQLIQLLQKILPQPATRAKEART